MPLHYLLILSLIQGVTEFMPVSSSGHLVLVHTGLGGDAAGGHTQNRMLDVAVHIGTLIAALIYFRRDIYAMLGYVRRMRRADSDDPGRRLLAFIIVASLPVIIGGFIVHMADPVWLRSLEVVAWTTLVFGIVLWVCDHYAPDDKNLSALTWRSAFMIGAAQTLALIPGTSRAGITMSAGRALGFARTESARFSMLLAIVAISGAGVLSCLDVIANDNFALGIDMVLAAFMAAIAGWLAIALLMHWLARASFTPFVIYRLVLGGGLLFLIYGGYVPAYL